MEAGAHTKLINYFEHFGLCYRLCRSSHPSPLLVPFALVGVPPSRNQPTAVVGVRADGLAALAITNNQHTAKIYTLVCHAQHHNSIPTTAEVVKFVRQQF